jgi:hypothetical protein
MMEKNYDRISLLLQIHTDNDRISSLNMMTNIHVEPILPHDAVAIVSISDIFKQLTKVFF